MDDHSPPQLYLCQVNDHVSCGACCGLYNVTDPNRDKLLDRLARRTARFAATARTEDGIEAFRRAIEGWTPEDRPFPQFHHCPFLGLIGTACTRVGCLLHPEAPGNDGFDFRYLSYYGAKACRTYFCPATTALPVRYGKILQAVLDDWYAYGLIITEHHLLKAVFEILEARIGRMVIPGDFRADGEAAAHMRELLDLKQYWSYHRADARGVCHFPFENGLYPRQPVDWPGAYRPSRCYQVIFRELESGFGSEADVRRAEKLLVDHVEKVSNRLNRSSDEK